MKKRVAVLMALIMSMSFFAGCGAKNEQESKTVDVRQEKDMSVGNSEEDIVKEETADQLEAIGDIDVDKGIFDVTLTIPADFVGEVTQEELDETAEQVGYQSATLNDDGSVTYVMTKAQHKEMLAELRKNIEQSLNEMVKSENYPNITAITANENFTVFTVTTQNDEPDFAESLAVIGFYLYGGTYAVFSGDEVDNIHVDFINESTGEIISSADSKDTKE